MKKFNILLLTYMLSFPLFGQVESNLGAILYPKLGVKTIENNIFKVIYSEELEQPIKLWYTITCTDGKVERGGINFRGVMGIKTSSDEDYENNVWDKGHLAPAASFNCTREDLKSTFTYLNCALQHQGLNRGPWKELERFERDLVKIYGKVDVFVEVLFELPLVVVPAGATVPSGFTKTLTFNNESYTFTFPNKDVAGKDWNYFRIN